MVLAAGLGTRMRPLTENVPKPLVEVKGRPLIDWTLDLLVRSGIRRAVVNCSYKADMLIDYLNSRNDIEIEFSREDEPLETGGGIVNALPKLGDKPFFVINSDIIWFDNAAEPVLHRMARKYDEKSMDGLLLVFPTVRAVGYRGQGDFFMGQRGEIRLREEREVAPFAFTGIQLLHPRLFQGMKPEAFPLRVIYAKNPEHEWHDRLFALSGSGEWLHVGDPEGIAASEALIDRLAKENPQARKAA